MNYDRGAMKRAVKAQMKKTHPNPWVVALIYLALTTFVPAVIMFFVGRIGNPTGVSAGGWLDLLLSGDIVDQLEDLFRGMAISGAGDLLGQLWSMVGRYLVGAAIISGAVSLVLTLYQLFMRYGLCGWTLNVVRGEKSSIGDLFGGFTVFGRALGAAIMTYIFTFLWGLLYNGVGSLLVALIMFLCIGVGRSVWIIIIGALVSLGIIVFDVILNIRLGYRYCLTPYFIMSDRSVGVMAAITASKRSMKGNYGKRFWLDVSFIGWAIIKGLLSGMVAIGVGVLFFGAAFAGGSGSAMLASITSFIVMVGQLSFWSWLVYNVLDLVLQTGLTAYMECTYAAFFVTVTGGGVGQSAGRAMPGMPPMPPQTPPRMPQTPPQMPQVPQAPQTPQATGSTQQLSGYQPPEPPTQQLREDPPTQQLRGDPPTQQLGYQAVPQVPQVPRVPQTPQAPQQTYQQPQQGYEARPGWYQNGPAPQQPQQPVRQQQVPQVPQMPQVPQTPQDPRAPQQPPRGTYEARPGFYQNDDGQRR